MILFILMTGLSSCLTAENFLGGSSPRVEDEHGIKTLNSKLDRESISVQMLDQGTYVFPAEKQKVWSAILDVLGKNYGILVLDEKSGVMATDWDTFYLEGQTRRNKISIRMSSDGPNLTKLLLVNNDEVLKEKADNFGYLWLPSGDNKTEMKRIIKNTASILGHNTPDL